MKYISLAFSYLILVAAIILLSWGVLGFLEYLFGVVLLMPLQNPTFPKGTQFIHWLLITTSGATYIIGYLSKWKYTPIAMILLYGMLATMCSIQTFDFMTNESRYIDFVRECFYYVVISIYLLQSKRMQERYGRVVMQRRKV